MYSAVHDMLIDERELRICSNGTGPPLLMLHDLGDSAAVFEQLTGPVCEARRELVALDLPGSGHSDPVPTTDLASFVEYLALALPALADGKTIDIGGHGFGGYLALSLAATLPDMFGHVVVVDPALPPRSGPAASSRMSMGMAVNGALTTLRRGKLRQNLSGLSRARSVLDQLAQADPAWWDRLATITAPTLILGHSGADTGERALLDQLAGAVPDAKRNTVAGGRRPHVADPADFAGHVLDFVAT
ncbi:alpha/beta fold hydrolase [Nakamurella sp. YIM 132087]|uniref:Alpha/beta fold hydrolase n=1 Tax=Nakamurella alba TaxID=2665158 RepID=A0A7K1FII6_9ACTN|nr:alpha/beta hydrolase [Nakamurella alba]MTD12704.1 alpha/beta fold hydrolase [Nakamurella alba]